MEWVQVNNRLYNRGGIRKKQSVRCTFCKLGINKRTYLRVYISNDLIEKLGINTKKKVNFYLNEDNNKIWLLKQIENDGMYTLTKVNNTCHQISMVWNYFEFDKKYISIKELKHDFYDGGLRIYYED